MRALFKKYIHPVIKWLSVRSESGGLHISDSSLLYVTTGSTPRALSLKVPPGILHDGKIVLRDEFIKLLEQFHKMIVPANTAKKDIPVIVSLPSSLVYTQSFTVPNIGDDRLHESALLNLKMISPIPAEAAYMHYQVIQSTQEKHDALGAFADKQSIDDIRNVLSETHFVPLALEFPSISIARLIEQRAQAFGSCSLIFQVSGDGLDLSIVRNGGLYFAYFRPWSSIQRDAREISRAMFESIVAQEVQKVINFTLGRFKETPDHIYLVAPALEESISKFLTMRFNIPVEPLRFVEWNIEPQWYVALGAAIRGSSDRSRDASISLAPVASAELFLQEQTISFIELWRNIIVGTFALFLVFFGGAAYRLEVEARSLQERVTALDIKPTQELKDLSEKAKEFNALVGVAIEARTPVLSWSRGFRDVQSLALLHGVVIERFEIRTSGDGVATMSARVPSGSLEVVGAFERSLKTTKGIESVDLPLRLVGKLDDGSAAFTVSFNIVELSQ